MSKSKRQAFVRRTKSARNLLLIVSAFAIMAVISIAAGWLIQQLQSLRCPSGTFLVGSGGVASICQIIPIYIASIGFGFLIVNWLSQLMPPVREFFDRDALRHGVPGYQKAQQGLLRFSVIISAIALPMIVAASLSQYCMLSGAIFYQPWPWTGLKHYAWHDVTKIETRCHFSKGKWNGSFFLIMNDGSNFDIMAWPGASVRAYPEIVSALKNVNFSFDSTNVRPDCEVWYVDLLTRRP